MYGENKDCPIRITCITGYTRSMVEHTSERLIKEFGWKHHSWALLETHVYPKVHSRILFHVGEIKEGEQECQKTS